MYYRMTIWTFFMVWTTLLVELLVADDESGFPIHNSDTTHGYYIGDKCVTGCSDVTTHTVCNNDTHTCQCHPDYPIAVTKLICVKPLKLGERCDDSNSCDAEVPSSVCAPVDDYSSECQCKEGFHPEPVDITNDKFACSSDSGSILYTDIPTAIGVGVGLVVFTGLICLVLRLFSRARFARHRGYGNANLPPPITLSASDHGRHSRHSSQRSTPGGSRRQSYSMLAPPPSPMSRRGSSFSGISIPSPGSGKLTPVVTPHGSFRRKASRRASSSSVRSQSSQRSYSFRHQTERGSNHEGLRATQSMPGDGDVLSPRSPKSTEQLITKLEEIKENGAPPSRDGHHRSSSKRQQQNRPHHNREGSCRDKRQDSCRDKRHDNEDGGHHA